ncbi:MAG TPA: cystatin domain-containing protein [Pyrinomonadaceae bacterium]|nr:cystatin domain-containing protein [Pyrinomonadaceae bacterium]
MKKFTQKILMFVGLYLLTGGLLGVSAQQIVGDYRKIMKTDAGALSAAKFAVKQEKRKKENRRLSLASIERAESQIVAGTNYKICMKVINNGKIEDVSAVVYLNPKNKFSLTSWEKGVCKIDNN